MKKKALLGIDAGSSSVKICSFAPDGSMLQSINRPVTLQFEPGGSVSFEPEAYWHLCCSIIKEMLCPGDLDVQGIGFSTACPSMVFMDHRFAPVRPGIPYLDNRASRQVKRLREKGLRLDNPYSVSSCSIANAMWVRENEPETWGNTDSVGMLNSYLAGNLTGQAAVDWTQASYSGIFDLKAPGLWDQSSLALTGIEEEKLLPPAKPFDRIGTVNSAASRLTGLPEGCPVALGAADTAAAAFAVGLEEPGWAFESVGTSGVLTFVLDKPDFDPVFMNRCHVYPGKWLAHGAMSLMGGALEWVRKKIWDEYSTPSEMDAVLSESRPGAGGVVFLPYLAGERSPVWDPDAVGVWYGLTLASSKADMIEAVYESSAYGMKQILDIASEKFGCQPGSILAVGNGTKGECWNQIKADVLQVPYYPVQNADAAAFGAAMMGGIASGLFSGPYDPQIPQLQKSGKEYLPCGNDLFREYEKSYRVYISLYPALKSIHGNPEEPTS